MAQISQKAFVNGEEIHEIVVAPRTQLKMYFSCDTKIRTIHLNVLDSHGGKRCVIVKRLSPDTSYPFVYRIPNTSDLGNWKVHVKITNEEGEVLEDEFDIQITKERLRVTSEISKKQEKDKEVHDLEKASDMSGEDGREEDMRVVTITETQKEVMVEEGQKEVMVEEGQKEAVEEEEQTGVPQVNFEGERGEPEMRTDEEEDGEVTGDEGDPELEQNSPEKSHTDDNALMGEDVEIQDTREIASDGDETGEEGGSAQPVKDGGLEIQEVEIESADSGNTFSFSFSDSVLAGITAVPELHNIQLPEASTIDDEELRIPISELNGLGTVDRAELKEAGVSFISQLLRTPAHVVHQITSAEPQRISYWYDQSISLLRNPSHPLRVEYRRIREMENEEKMHIQRYLNTPQAVAPLEDIDIDEETVKLMRKAEIRLVRDVVVCNFAELVALGIPKDKVQLWKRAAKLYIGLDRLDKSMWNN